MAGRRKLIVVSNRAPVLYDRPEGGERIARRGGGGLVTALRSLVEHHDVTWIASAISEEDREVAEAAGSEPIEESRVGEPRTGSASSRTTRPPTTGSTTWSRTPCCGSSSTTSGAWPPPPTSTTASTMPGARATSPSTRLRRRCGRRARARAGRRRLLPRLPPLRCSGARARARPEALIRTSCTSPGRCPTTGAFSRADPTGRPRGPARQRRRQLSHAALAHSFLRCCVDILGVEPDLRGSRSRSPAASPGRGRDRSRSTPPSSTSSPRARRCSPRRQAIEEVRPEFLILRVDRTDPSKNVVRGFRAYELYLDAHPEMHGRVQMLALLDPSRQDIPEYAEYLGAIQRAARAVNDRFQRDGWSRSTSRSRTTSRRRWRPTSSSTSCS